MDALSVPSLIVNLVTEARGVDDRQGDAGALLIELELCAGVRDVLPRQFDGPRI